MFIILNPIFTFKHLLNPGRELILIQIVTIIANFLNEKEIFCLKLHTSEAIFNNLLILHDLY